MRLLYSNWSKGELSDIIDGHSNLAAYYEGASVLENWLILRQGGITRWPGSRLIAEVKDPTRDVILWPFEFSTDDAYVLEVGHQYIRVYKNKAPVIGVSGPVDIPTPFDAADIRSIHITQSADVIFTFHHAYRQRRLSRISDTEWTLIAFSADPPPSFEGDESLEAKIALASNSGSDVAFRVTDGVLLPSDEGRQIIIGSGRAIVTAYSSASGGTCDVLDDFSQTIQPSVNTCSTTSTTFTSVDHGLDVDDAVVLTDGPQVGQIRFVATVTDANEVVLDAAFSANQTTRTWSKVTATMSGSWAFRLSPQTTLDPTRSGPVGSQVTLVSGAGAFKSTHVGKYISIYGGLVVITNRVSATEVRGTILARMVDATSSNPAAAPAGSWFIHEPSWSTENGWPRTGEFCQGRLFQASTDQEKTTFWGSASDNFVGYGPGVTEADAINFTLAVRQVNQIEWITEIKKKIVLGTSGAEVMAEGSGSDNTVLSSVHPPLIDRIAFNGVAPIQPVSGSKSTLLYIDKSRRKVFSLGFDIDADGETDNELTLLSSHITGPGVQLGPLSFQRRLDPRLFFCRTDGQLVSMTYFPEQKVVGFTRRTTEGRYESQCVIPSGTNADEVWVVVTRTINGVEKKFIEVFEPNHEQLQGRGWTGLHTDCAIVVSGMTGTSVQVPHLSGCTVAVMKNGVYLGKLAVEGSSIELADELVPEDVLEIGLPFRSTATSMRVASPQAVTDGLQKSINFAYVRLKDSLGGTINGEPIMYPTEYATNGQTFTGGVKVLPEGWSDEARISIVQDEPYPMTVLSIMVDLVEGDHA